MWRHNKVGIIALFVGLALLGGAYALIAPCNPLLARQVLSLGVCVLLFAVALASWVSVKKPREDDEE